MHNFDNIHGGRSNLTSPADLITIGNWLEHNVFFNLFEQPCTPNEKYSEVGFNFVQYVNCIEECCYDEHTIMKLLLNYRLTPQAILFMLNNSVKEDFNDLSNCIKSIMYLSDKAMCKLKIHVRTDNLKAYAFHIRDYFEYYHNEHLVIELDGLESIKKGEGCKLVKNVLRVLTAVPIILQAGFLHYGDYECDTGMERVHKLVTFYESMGFVNVNNYIGNYEESVVLLNNRKEVLRMHNFDNIYDWCSKLASPAILEQGKQAVVEAGLKSYVNSVLGENYMIFYHGTKDIDFKPSYLYDNPDNDYGSGLYLTHDLEKAKEWSMSPYTSGDKGYVFAYAVPLSDLNIYIFDDKDVIKWITVLLYNRHLARLEYDSKLEILFSKNLVKLDGYDAVIGYRADDNYSKFAVDYINVKISTDTLFKALVAGNLGKQLCLKSKHAFDKLVPLCTLNVDKKYKELYAKKETTASKRYQELRKTTKLDFNDTVLKYL